MYIFDLDGVLVDSLKIVREAYKEVGVVWRPGHWSRWPGCTPHHHEEKVKVYQRMLEENKIEPLPMAELYAELVNSNYSTVMICTTADGRTTPSLLRAAGLPQPHGLVTNCVDKDTYFFSLYEGGLKTAIVFEDTPVQVPKGWTLCLV